MMPSELMTAQAKLEAQLKAANQRIREADAQVKCALLVVAAEQSNVTRAEARLAEAEAAADAAREPQLLAQEAAAEIREALAMQRRAPQHRRQPLAVDEQRRAPVVARVARRGGRSARSAAREARRLERRDGGEHDEELHRGGSINFLSFS